MKGQSVKFAKWGTMRIVKKRSVTYRNVCLLCKEKGTDAQYIGETSLSGFERANVHVDEGVRRLDKSHINIHLQSDHPDYNGTPREAFGMRIVREHQTAYLRELHEVVLIQIF